MTGRCILAVLLLLCISELLCGQTKPPEAPSRDTLRPVEILHADRYEFRSMDSVKQLQILTGSVKIRQDATYFEADSMLYDEKTMLLEAYGKVYVNDGVTISIRSRQMRYDGIQKQVYFSEQVVLSDGKSTLYTPRMDYDLNTNTGIYTQGGKTVNGSTILNSRQGIYYADTKDIYFSGDVDMKDDGLSLKSDSLLYNTETEIATFISETEILNKSTKIRTREGYYDLKEKKARFANRIRVEDSSSVLIANDFLFDEKSGEGYASGNVRYKDTVQGLLLFANKTVFNRNEGRFRATEKPVLVIVQESDSIYIAADTIYSAYIREIDSSKRTAPLGSAAISGNASKKTNVSNDASKDTLVRQPHRSSREADQKIPKNTSDSLIAKHTDTTLRQSPSVVYPDTLRMLQAFRHVRIFSDSLQAVCDSLFFSSTDSIFQLYKDPVAWARNQQVSGDTLFIFSENKKPKRVAVFENARLAEEISRSRNLFNQVKARIINSYFKDGLLEKIEAGGNAECIYYAADEEKALVGMNRTEADKINMLVDQSTAQRISFLRAVKGITYPISQIPEDQKLFPGFQWEESRRPKSKYELFQ
jgi:lipopolysaccharide export system protein LptA